MQKSIFHTVFSFLLIGLVLISSTGFTVNAHYCMDDLKGINFFGEAKSCHEQKSTCPFHQEVDKNNCCSNKTLKFESLDEDYTIADLMVTPSIVLSLPVQLKPKVLKPVYNKNIYTSYINYRPPPLIEDIQAQFATFII